MGFRVILAMLQINYSRCKDCAFTANIVKGGTGVSYFVEKVWSLNCTQEKSSCRGNKGSGTEISSCAIYL